MSFNISHENKILAKKILNLQYYNRRSYMSTHVLLNLFNESMKSDKMQGLASILSLFRKIFNKFNNTGA